MKVPKMKNPPPTPENSMAQANANYDKWRDDRDVEKAFKEWTENQEFLWWANIGGTEKMAVVRNMKQFALYFAKRCGVVFTDNKPSSNT